MVEQSKIKCEIINSLREMFFNNECNVNPISLNVNGNMIMYNIKLTDIKNYSSLNEAKDQKINKQVFP